MILRAVIFSLSLFIYGDLIVGEVRGSSGDKYALVVGNSMYQHSSELGNPYNDAKAMDKKLQELGFKTTVVYDSGKKAMMDAIDQFGANLPEGATALFYYAGHGVQSGGFNYLVPTDADLAKERDIEYDCVRADRILSVMENKASISIIVLDACRDNPFAKSWSRSSSSRGLAMMDAPSGSLIAYATSPGSTASDGSGSNGLYTAALLEAMSIPNLTIEQTFKKVRKAVMTNSNGLQQPWESTSMVEDFYFTQDENIVRESSLAAVMPTSNSRSLVTQSIVFEFMNPKMLKCDIVEEDGDYNCINETEIAIEELNGIYDNISSKNAFQIQLSPYKDYYVYYLSLGDESEYEYYSVPDLGGDLFLPGEEYKFVRSSGEKEKLILLVSSNKIRDETLDSFSKSPEYFKSDKSILDFFDRNGGQEYFEGSLFPIILNF